MFQCHRVHLVIGWRRQIRQVSPVPNCRLMLINSMQAAHHDVKYHFHDNIVMLLIFVACNDWNEHTHTHKHKITYVQFHPHSTWLIKDLNLQKLEQCTILMSIHVNYQTKWNTICAMRLILCDLIWFKLVLYAYADDMTVKAYNQIEN